MLKSYMSYISNRETFHNTMFRPEDYAKRVSLATEEKQNNSQPKQLEKDAQKLFLSTVGLYAVEATAVATAIDSPEKLGDPFVAGLAAGVIAVGAIVSTKRYLNTLKTHAS